MAVKYSDVNKVLQQLAPYGPVVCAGGYIRDTLLDRPYKDVDIFFKSDRGIPLRNLPHKGIKKNIFGYNKVLQGHTTKIITYDLYGLFPDDYRTDPINGYISDTVTQVVCIDSTISLEDYVTQTFDFNLCKVWMTPDGRIHTSQQYLYDVSNKTCTFALDADKFTFRDFCRTIDHGRCIAAKYPDFKMNYGNLYRKIIEDAVRCL